MMTPIHELLSRIRWDPEFGKGDFQVGYYDRVENRLVMVPFEQIDFPQDAPDRFELTDAGGAVHRIPFHRVRAVLKDGQQIWHRP